MQCLNLEGMKLPHVMQKLNARIVVCVSNHFIETTSLRNTALATYGKTNLRLEPLKWQDEIWLWTACSKTGRAVLVCVPNWLLTIFVDAVQIYGNSNEWMGLHTNIFLSTDHLPTTYWAPTEHFFMVQLFHNYWTTGIWLSDCLIMNILMVELTDGSSV